MIILEPCAGLGNRILALATTYEIAMHCNHNIIVLWDIDGAVGIPLNGLFILPKKIRIITTTKLPYHKRFFLRCKSEVIRCLSKMWTERFLDCCDIEELKRKNEFAIRREFQNNRNIYVKSFCELEKITDKHIFQIFSPSKEILSYGEGVFQKINGNTVGLHIRRTDHEEAIRRSPFHLFIQKIDELIEADCSIQFFLATDDENVEEELIKTYGTKIICKESKKFSRNDEKGMMDGLVDMLALSKCTTIYGSYGSTFSRMASYLGNTELMIVEI